MSKAGQKYKNGCMQLSNCEPLNVTHTLGYISGLRCSSVSGRYLELLGELATEPIKHGQVKGAKVCVEAERERKRTQGDTP